jgi:hypothetical protein
MHLVRTRRASLPTAAFAVGDATGRGGAQMIRKHEPGMKATHGVRTPAVVTESLRASDNEIRMAAETARSRRMRGAVKMADVPVSDVVARLLAAQLVRKPPARAVRIRKSHLRGLSRRVAEVLERSAVPVDRGVIAAKAPNRRPVRDFASSYIKPHGARALTELRRATDDDVRRAIEETYSRNRAAQGPTEVSVTTVMTDLLADQLASHIVTDPDLVRVNGDIVRSLASEIAEELPHVPPDSPWRRAIGPVYEIDAVQTMLDLATPADVVALAAKGSIIMLHTADGYAVFPCFQFAHGNPLPGLAEVLRAAADDIDAAPWTVAAWLQAPLTQLNGASVVDVLAAGDSAAAVRATAAVWGGAVTA